MFSRTLIMSYLFSLWLVLTLNFALPRLLPGDPLAALFDPNGVGYLYDPAAREALGAYYGLDAPLWVQYFTYLAGIPQGDLGHSIRLKQPVSVVLAGHLPYTLLLTLTSLTASSVIGIWGGSEAAWRQGSVMDRMLVIAGVTVSNIPVFFSGMLLLIVFGAELRWLPLAGGRTAFAHYDHLWALVRDYGTHLVLPALTLTLALVGSKFLLIRGTMVGVLGADYMLVARAKGLTSRQIKRDHGLRNAILPFVHHLAAHAGFALTGALFIETLFSYPGVGRLIFESVGARDYPVIQGVFVVVSVLVLTTNLVADGLSRWLDPRLREP